MTPFLEAVLASMTEKGKEREREGEKEEGRKTKKRKKKRGKGNRTTQQLSSYGQLVPHHTKGTHCFSFHAILSRKINGGEREGNTHRLHLLYWMTD